MAAQAFEIERLPVELVSEALSRVSPRDVLRAAAVSAAFRAVADSDAVWSSYLPRDLPPLADGELSPVQRSNKELFLLLSDRPVLLRDRLVSIWLDRETGAKCYMLSARALTIVWSDYREYWRWISLDDSRFSEGVELMAVCWLEIRGMIHSNMLSHNSAYSVYMVFKIADVSYGLEIPLQEASISLGEIRTSRQVRLDHDDSDEGGLPENVAIPVKRADGWMELELGEFFNEEGEDGQVSISLTETKGGHWKRGLIVHGIEIRKSG